MVRSVKEEDSLTVCNEWQKVEGATGARGIERGRWQKRECRARAAPRGRGPGRTLRQGAPVAMHTYFGTLVMKVRTRICPRVGLHGPHQHTHAHSWRRRRPPASPGAALAWLRSNANTRTT